MSISNDSVDNFISEYVKDTYAFTWTVPNFSKIEYDVTIEINTEFGKWKATLQVDSTNWSIYLHRCFDGPGVVARTTASAGEYCVTYDGTYRKAGDFGLIQKGSHPKLEDDVFHFKCILSITGHKTKTGPAEVTTKE